MPRGHIHIYRPDEITKTYFLETQVINTYQYRETNLEIVEDDSVSWLRSRAQKLLAKS